MARKIVILSLLLAGAGAWAQESYVVSIEAHGTSVRPGLVYGETSTGATGGIVLPTGETGNVYLAFDESPDGAICNRASGGGRSLDDVRREFLEPLHDLLVASVRPLPAEIGRIRIEVSWDHLRRDAQGPARRVAGDVRTIDVREGEFHVLDFLQGRPTAASYCYANVVVGVRAEVREDESLAAARFRYDVWWKHTDAAGRVENRRFLGTGRQGEVVPFQLGERRQPVPESKDGKRWESILELSGEVQARARSDGRIDLRLGAGRYVDTEIEGTPRRGGIGDGGRKVVTVDPGETIALRLPSPGGRVEFVDSKAFYAGHTDELILTVTREK